MPENDCMTRTAYLILGDKFVSLGIETMKSDNYLPPSPYDGLSIKNTINILEQRKFQIKSITYYDLLEENFSDVSIFIVSQWILNRFEDMKDILINLRKKINLLTDNGNHFILMHHFWLYFIFNDILDISYYSGNQSRRFQNKFSLKILENHRTSNNVKELIKDNLENFASDEFTFLFREESKFKTLIQKIQNTKQPKNFISYGYQKNNKSFIFLIDIHNIGKIESHSMYFNLLFNNTIDFLIKSV